MRKDFNLLLETAFDSTKLGKRYFEFDDDVVTYIGVRIKQHSTYGLFKCVINYLISISPEFKYEAIKEQIRRYGIVISYMYAKKAYKKNFEYSSAELDNIISTHEYPDKLKDKNNPFVALYNDSSKFKKSAETLEAELDKNTYLDIYRVLRNEFDFFSDKSDLEIFSTKDKIKRYDMLIAEAIEEKSDSFKFEITDIEAFKKNLKDTNDAYITYCSVIMGYYIDSYIKYGDYDHVIPEKYYMATYCRDISVGWLNCFDGVKGNFNINPKLITPFEFKYNNVEYTIIDGVPTKK